MNGKDHQTFLHSHPLLPMSSIDIQARILEAMQQVNEDEALTKMYLFPWEEESLRASYQPIEFFFDMGNSDEYNECFLPHPIMATNFMQMISKLGDYEFIQALKHARNATNGRVDFGAYSI